MYYLPNFVIQKKKIDLWAIKLYASCFLSDELVLYPYKTLEINIGERGVNFNSEYSGIIGSKFYIRPNILKNQNTGEPILLIKKWTNHFKTNSGRKVNQKSLGRVLYMMKSKIIRHVR